MSCGPVKGCENQLAILSPSAFVSETAQNSQRIHKRFAAPPTPSGPFPNISTNLNPFG